MGPEVSSFVLNSMLFLLLLFFFLPFPIFLLLLFPISLLLFLDSRILWSLGNRFGLDFLSDCRSKPQPGINFDRRRHVDLLHHVDRWRQRLLLVLFFEHLHKLMIWESSFLEQFDDMFLVVLDEFSMDVCRDGFMREPAFLSQMADSIDMEEPARVEFGLVGVGAFLLGTGPRQEELAYFLR